MGAAVQLKNSLAANPNRLASSVPTCAVRTSPMFPLHG